MPGSTTIHDLKTLVSSYQSIIAIETLEEQRVGEFLLEVAEDLGVTLFDWTITRGVVKQGVKRDTHMGSTKEPDKMLGYIVGLQLDAVYHLKDFAQHLTNPAISRLLREVVEAFHHRRSCLVLTGHEVKLPEDIEPITSRYILQMPSREELKRVLESTVHSLRERHPVRVDLTGEETEQVLEAMVGLTLNQARQSIAHALLDDNLLNPEDIPRIRQHKARLIRDGGLLEYFPPSENHFEIGGFDNLKDWLARSAVGFSQEARTLGLSPPRGILIVGVQGCGKSLAAKVIARQWGISLLKFDAGRLYNKYIGETERQFREAVRLAESVAPCVLWIDEIEKGFGGGGDGETDGGTSRRLLASFLTWLQEKVETVFVVATANDLSTIPPELMRKGRFDEVFFVDLPSAEERARIFEIHLRLRNQDPSQFDIESLVVGSEGFSGAEIEQAIIAGLYRALYQKQAPDTALIRHEIESTVPLSVSRAEEIAALRADASKRFVSVHRLDA